ncbi:hypothetical protein SLA2020_261580 [Shorea laevis]
MMARNPNLWSMHPPSLFPQYALGSASLPFNPLPDHQDPPHSWSQLLSGGLSAGEEEKFVMSQFQATKLENWEDQILNPSPRNDYNIFDFSYNKNQQPDQSSESSSTGSGGVYKKAKVVSSISSSQPPLKVRKEKLGDRITALHQLVSPFGKTDTASVLLEAIGYIRFLLGQIETLSSPYLGNESKNMRNQQSLLNETSLKRKGAPNQDIEDKPKELASRGLCLVPVSCTQLVGNDNGADYWAPAYGTPGF